MKKLFVLVVLAWVMVLQWQVLELRRDIAELRERSVALETREDSSHALVREAVAAVNALQDTQKAQLQRELAGIRGKR